MYLRVDSSLRIPVVTFQHSRCHIPINACEAHELAYRTLLLSRVGWRHLVSVTFLLKCATTTRDKVKLRGESEVGGAKSSLTRGSSMWGGMK
jgi:hypothetical protein